MFKKYIYLIIIFHNLYLNVGIMYLINIYLYF